LYTAPFDVRLPNPRYPESSRKIHTVVQPDLCVFYDLSKLDDNGAIGAPDCIIEITLVGTIKKDFGEKFSLYEESGVREYWIVVPESKSVHQYRLENTEYVLERLYEASNEDEESVMRPTIFPELPVNLEEVFAGI
jgi:Uma2 family endonuclease